MKHVILIICCLFLPVIILAGCSAEQPAGPDPALLGSDAPRVCLLNGEDTGGSSRSEAQAWQTASQYDQQGLLEIRQLSLVSDSDWPDVGGCSLVLLSASPSAESYLMQTRNASVPFVLLGGQVPPGMDHGLGLVFRVEQPAFLAGYLAAGISSSANVATFGSADRPEMATAMEAFYQGVQHYNQIHNAQVAVLGWDPSVQAGLSTGESGVQSDGRALTNALLDQGADVIFPVTAGEPARGAVSAIQDRGSAYMIGYDLDLIDLAGSERQIFLSSVDQYTALAVQTALDQFIRSNFQGGTLTGSLENGLVGLSEINSAVPEELRAEIEQLQADLIAGRLQLGTEPVFEGTPES